MTNKTFAQFGFKMSHIELLKIGTSLAQDEEFLPKHMSALSLVYIFHHSYLFEYIFSSPTRGWYGPRPDPLSSKPYFPIDLWV